MVKFDYFSVWKFTFIFSVSEKENWFMYPTDDFISYNPIYNTWLNCSMLFNVVRGGKEVGD